MTRAAHIRFDFDPSGNAQGYVAQWEREFAASALCTEAIEGARTPQDTTTENPARVPFWIRVAYFLHLGQRTRPMLHPGA